MQKEEVSRWPLLIILALYLLLALAYGAVNALFEAPDEHWHYFTAQTIAETNSLPIIGQEVDPWSGQEAAQPPLFYLLGAGIIKPFNTDQARNLIWLNPRVQLGDASSPTNTNAFVHTQAEDWPWQGHILAAHLIRILSTVFGLGTLLCIYGSGRLVWPKEPKQALLATAMVAFLPQFIFLHGSISNDTLIIFLCSAALWQLLRMWYDQMSWGRLLLLSVTVGLAILTKTAGLLLLIYSTGFVALIVWKGNHVNESSHTIKKWVRVGLIPGVALLIGGWLLWRNWQLYGDITASNQFVQIAGGDRQYSLLQVLKESSGLWISLFALFGWFNIRSPDWIYWIWYGIVFAAIVGVLLEVLRIRKGREPKPGVAESVNTDAPEQDSILERKWLPAVLLGLWVLMVYAGLLSFMMKTPAAQGRLLFPAVLPLALGLAYGLSRFRWRGVTIIAPVLALVTSVYGLLFVLPQAYSLPPVIAESEIPNEAGQVRTHLGQGLDLIASQVETTEALPGDWVWLTLYWQAQQVPAGANKLESPEYVLEVYGQDDELVGKLQSYHGGGLYPASLWTQNELVADTLAVHLNETMGVPTQVRLNLKVVGEQSSVDVGKVKVIPATWPSASSTILASLGGIELASANLSATSATPGETVTIDLLWQVISGPGRDLTTFVHLGDPARPPLAVGDSPPLGGDYPTGLWEAGEVINDSYSLIIPADLPPGRYPVHVGLYESDSGVRLPLLVDGVSQPNGAFLVGWLTIVE